MTIKQLGDFQVKSGFFKPFKIQVLITFKGVAHSAVEIYDAAAEGLFFPEKEFEILSINRDDKKGQTTVVFIVIVENPEPIQYI